MRILAIVSILLLVGCHRGKKRYMSVDDGIVLDKKSGEVFQIDAEKEPHFRYIGNLKDFQKSLEGGK